MPDGTTPAATPAAGRGPIRWRRIHEEVASRVRALIAESGLAPGDRLPSERELMAEFGVGRSAVREAMLTLQRAGVVVVSSGERARVARPSPRTLLNELSSDAARLLLAEPGGAERLADARVQLEVGLARYAARRATAADLATLAELLEASRRADGAGDPAALARAVSRLAGDADLRARLAAAATARTARLNDVEVTGRLLALYREALAARDGRH